MSSVYVGTNRADTLNSLATWLIKGPSVAFLEGAPGTGKTALASELRTSETAQELFRARIGHEVYDSEKPVFREVLAEIAGQLSVEGLTAMSEVLESHTSIDVGRALERALRQPVLIVIDEAQRFLNRLTQEPDEEFARALSRLRQRETRGRLLLISDRRFPREEIWAEWLLPHTLTKLSSSEARELFELRLRERGIVLDIATERISKILFDLDHNPRAIQTLVGALIESSIDEIIEDAPELWATADRVVSSDFLSKLERNLLEKTLKRIRPEHSRNIRMLSVHRRGVKRQALDKLCKGKEAGQQVVRILTSRFLANLSGVLSLNPIVREICLERLRDSANELKEAHSAAAEFYGRKFKAENMVGSDRELGIDFAELRYHLFNSGEFAKLGSVAHRFIRRVQSLIEKASPPANREDLDERIGLLSSLPEADRSIEIEYHLAQCLRARSSSDDLQKALQRVEEAIGPYSPPKVLHLLLQLSRELRGNEIALSVLKQALAQWKYSDASLYIAGAECVLATGGRPAAVAFLREGIARIGPDTSAVQLYQKAADLLYEGGNTDDAIEMMREGICCLSTEASSGLHLHAASFLLTLGRLSEALEFLHSAIAVAPIADCYNSATGLLFKHGHYEQALDLLKIGIAKISREESALSLYLNAAQHLAANEQQPQALALLREVITTTSANSAPLYLKTADLLVRLGSPRDAIDLARRGIPLVALSNRWELYFKAAELLSQFDDIDEAINLLKKGMEEVPPSHGLFSLYHSCGELLAIDRVDEAINLLKEGIAKTPPSQGLFSLYHSCGELLAHGGRVDEGINLLKEGIAKILPSQGLSTLYQSCGELLAQAGRVDESINLLKEGIAKILPSHGLSTLYQSYGELLAQADRVDEAINLLKEGMKTILPSQGLSVIYQTCEGIMAHSASHRGNVPALLKEGIDRINDNYGGKSLAESLLRHIAAVDDRALLGETVASIATRPNGGELKELAHVLELQIQNEWKQAAEQATEACLRYPHSFALMQQAAFSWLCEEAPERAEEAIALYSGIVRERQNSSIEWIRAFIADAKDDNKQAVKHLSLYRGRPLTHEEERASVVQQLIQLWLDQNDRSFGLGLSSLFPILPPSLTGLRKPLNRYGVCNVQPEDFTAPVAGGLDDNIRSALGTVYFDRRLNDADYQASFKSAGMEKAESVLQRFSEVPRESQCRYAYLSIGGADGSEIEWAMKRSSINKGLLLEYGTAAAASARKRISNLAKAGKTLLVIEGDAVQKLSEVSEALNAWKQAGYIDGIVVSAQSVLHELPYRSAGFSLSVFLGQLFKGWDNIFFYCREPCGPQGWPEVVQLRLKNVTGDALAGMARHIKAHLNFDGDVHSITDDFVEMPSNLALETLFKVLYLDSTFTYEMGEKLTAFDPEHVGKVLERYIGSNSVQIEYTVSDHFKREYQRTVDSVVDIQKQISLRMPNSFVRITASKRKS